MAHFAVAVTDPIGVRNYEALAEEIRDAVHAAGHSLSMWCVWKPEGTIKEFFDAALAVPKPVCVCYMGHGLPEGWYYDIQKGNKKIYSYRVLGKAVAKRKGLPTAIVGDCCHAGSIVEGFSGSGFDRQNTIAMTASSSGRVSLSTPTLSDNHTGRVFKAWFEKRQPFDPFDYDDNCVMDGGGNPRSWEKWLRLGPERFGSPKIDEHFFSQSR